MTSTLDVEFMKSKNAAREALDTRRNELAAEEADIAESRIRFEAERLVDFYDELVDRQVAEEVATIILRFKDFERTVGETTAAALRLASFPLDETTDVSQYNIMLNHVDSLEDVCQELETQVLRLSSDVPHSSKLSTILRDLSNILSGHAENVACTIDVVQRCKENYRMGVGTLTLI
ncbi:hypothetical protein LXA43DRAFT_988311 [Ganoderma leucocontextum]|nr:hypothetical protein LXA43DRAFT_988311 [Ganoderma leucocontextum]